MANKKISQLSSTAITGKEQIPVALSGANYSITPDGIKAYVNKDLDSTIQSNVQTALDNKTSSIISDASFYAFAALWEAACNAGSYSVGSVDYDTQTFALNGITNISYAEAKKIYRNSTNAPLGPWHTSDFSADYIVRGVTNLPLNIGYNAVLDCAFYADSAIEVVLLQTYTNPSDVAAYGRNASITTNVCASCTKLREVRGLVWPASKGVKLFRNCTKLQSVKFFLYRTSYFKNFSIADCPLIDSESIDFLIETALTDPSITSLDSISGITVTVHPDVYANLTNTQINAAAAKKISFATE